MPNTKSAAIAIVCALAALTFADAKGWAQQATPATPGASLAFTLKPLGHNVYAAIDDAKGDAGANAGFVIGDDGVAVIDTFENPEASKQMLAEIRKLTQLPIKFVVNTHYHIDHVAGNSLFQQNGAVVVRLTPGLAPKAFAVTLEPFGGRPQPTGPMVLVGAAG